MKTYLIGFLILVLGIYLFYFDSESLKKIFFLIKQLENLKFNYF